MMESAGNKSGLCAREKYWTERDRDEKLETLRQVVSELYRTVGRQRDQIELLMRHGHSIDGRVMQPAEHRGDYVFPEGYKQRGIPVSLSDPDENRR